MEKEKTAAEMLADINAEAAANAGKNDQEEEVEDTQEDTITNTEQEDKEEENVEDNEDKDKEEETEDDEEIKEEDLFGDEKEEDQEEDKEEEEDDDDALSDEDKQALDKRIDRKLKPVKDELTAREIKVANDERALAFDKYISNRPELAKHAEQIKKYINNDKFVKTGLKEDRLFDAVTAAVIGIDGLMKAGANRKAVVDDKAKKNHVGARNKPAEENKGEKDWLSASKEDFEKEYEKVMTGGN